MVETNRSLPAHAAGGRLTRGEGFGRSRSAPGLASSRLPENELVGWRCSCEAQSRGGVRRRQLGSCRRRRRRQWSWRSPRDGRRRLSRGGGRGRRDREQAAEVAVGVVTRGRRRQELAGPRPAALNRRGGWRAPGGAWPISPRTWLRRPPGRRTGRGAGRRRPELAGGGGVGGRSCRRRRRRRGRVVALATVAVARVEKSRQTIEIEPEASSWCCQVAPGS
jgi:hypothetical protein